MKKNLLAFFLSLTMAPTVFSQCATTLILRQNVCGGCQSGCSLCSFCSPACSGLTGNCSPAQSLSTNMSFTLPAGCEVTITASISKTNGTGCSSGAGADGGDFLKIHTNASVLGSGDANISDTYVVTSSGTYTVSGAVNRRDEQIFITTTPNDPVACGSCILPVKMGPITFEILEEYVLVSWSTLSETNNWKFILEKSLDGVNFEAVGEQAGAGDSEIMQYYSLLVANEYRQVSYFRIVQVDQDGSRTESMPVAIKMTAVDDVLDLSNLFVDQSNELHLTLLNAEEAETVVEIMDVSGKILATRVFSGSDVVSARLNVTDFKAGVYFVRAKNKYRQVTRKLFIP